ncbi:MULTISPECIES: hypothetical protein [Symbiopectobacterium]|uniref:hypothetical protein n=1 Tax=Symbiopectobacterium TaxID=801 RepID=UPI00207983C0|nr:MULTISPECIES: hypothetical protein [Symbiopectobacterium]MBT9430286.1 hypothetical protein [Candidatus Symbiopectobacterium endolongispinus]
MKKQNCMFCGAPATLLCDGVIGYDTDEDENGMMVSMPLKMHTCDAPMCRACATWQGNIFWHGKSSGMDSTDYCPICMALCNKGQNIRNHRLQGISREPCMTDEQASIIRRVHWASYQNKYQHGLKIEQGGGQQCLPF